MLRYLHIRNIAVIEELEVEFGPGLNVITGETGSGKSILIDAVGLLAGARGSTDLIRSGENRAMVEGIFDLPAGSPVWPLLNDEGIERDELDDGLLIRRELAVNFVRYTPRYDSYACLPAWARRTRPGSRPPRQHGLPAAAG